MAIERKRWRLGAIVAGVLAAVTTTLGLAQGIAFQRGDHVREKIVTAPNEPKRTGMTVTVVARPGDAVEVTGTTVLSTVS